ncbi:DNA polymerase I [Sphingoaurantiacus capsulatus]|uniref:DNA polymerase I n=1 Tax=Sphingoaurantiacus capsulatus TaxID=1771310 RepID=A0ABV7XAS3_9SPHN
MATAPDDTAAAPAPAKQKHLYLVDGSGFIFRAYHRLPPLNNPAGTPVNAVYGFTAMLWKLIEDLHGAEEPTHLAVIFDAAKDNFRNELYADYKANRPPPPEDLLPQFPLIRDAVRAFSVPCIEMSGFEADDIIACYVAQATAAGYNVTIVSSDKDLMQLVTPHVDMLDTMKNERYGVEAVTAKWGVPPEKLGEVLALMGDSVDNVPGVPGVGPKTAAELVQQFGDVEGVLANLDQIKKPKLRENLEAHAEMARLSRVLVELKCDLDPPHTLGELVMRDPPHDPLRAFLAEQGFKSMLAKLGRESQAAEVAAQPDEPEKPFVHAEYETVITLDRLDWWLAEARARGVVAIDTETTAKDPVRCDLVGVSLALDAGLACYIPVAHVQGEGLLAEKVDQLAWQDVKEKLGPLLVDPAVLKVGQNLKYDLVVLKRHGLDLAGFDDTMLLSYALSAGKHNHGMDELSEKYLGHTPIPFKEVCGTGKSQCTFDQVPLKRATDYAAEDADVTLRLHRLFRPRLSAEQVTRTYETVDKPLLPVLADMELEGIKVDREALARLSATFGTEIAALETEVHDLAGGPFTIGSPKQLGEVLFERMQLSGGKKSGKSGQYATDVNELEKLAGQGHVIAQKVLDWRQLTKLKSTYTDALQAAINPKTGRVHTCFSMAVAQTGRLSSTDPNLQNIPIRTEIGRQIRHAFVAKPGHVILAADYNQIELRLAAHMADVPELKRAYANNEDIHALTAREVFGTEMDPQESRRRAKTVNFAILYGISAFGLANRLGLDRGEAQRIIDAYFARFPGIRNFMAETINGCRETGFVTTLFGRRTNLPLIHSKNPAERQFAERAAVNAPVQGTSADIIKRAMIRMPLALAEAGLTGVRMLLQVHDELVFEVPERDVEAATPVIRSVMESAHRPAVELSVPLGVEIGTGPSWGAAH